MGMKEKEYLTNPATGKPFTRAERLARLDDRFADQTIPQGAPPGTLAERQQQRKAQSELQREIAEQVAAKAAESRPAANPFAAHVAELESRLKWAAPHEVGGIERRLGMFREQAEQWAAERAAEVRRAAFKADPAISNLLEHAEALERSHKVSHPDVAAEDVAFVLALASSDAFATPGEQSAAYWQAVRVMEEKQAAAEAARMQDATSKALAASAEYQAQRQRLTEAEQRAAHSAKMEGGGSESV
jgi:hypothetical protein